MTVGEYSIQGNDGRGMMSSVRELYRVLKTCNLFISLNFMSENDTFE